MIGKDETGLALKRRARAMHRILADTYPDARIELDFRNPFELLVATILAAQSTDKRVNQVTPRLFARYPDAAALSRAELAEVEDLIHSTGFFHAKAAHLVNLGVALTERFHGDVPHSLDELVSLPGVGRKTANVVLGNAFGIPGIVTDTHFLRLSRRFGWSQARTADVVEREVGALFDKRDWIMLSHRVTWHGRRRCHARRPACGACPVAHLCPAWGEGPTDPEVAAALVREPRG